MHIFKWLSLLFPVFICCGCGNALPQLEGIDGEKWKADKNACGAARTSMRGAIDEQKEKLLALNEMEIVELLGKPDQNELSSRNQKFFYYFLDPAPSCVTGADSVAERLVIRFNAVGLASEVLIE